MYCFSKRTNVFLFNLHNVPKFLLFLYLFFASALAPLPESLVGARDEELRSALHGVYRFRYLYNKAFV